MYKPIVLCINSILNKSYFVSFFSSGNAMHNPDLVRSTSHPDPSYATNPNNPYAHTASPMSTLGSGGTHPGAHSGAPPPYNGDTSYDSGYDPYGTDVSAFE